MDKIDLKIIDDKCKEIKDYFPLNDYSLINNKFLRVVFMSIMYGNFYFDLNKTKNNKLEVISSNINDITEYSLQEQKFLNTLQSMILSAFEDYEEKKSLLENKEIEKKLKGSKSEDKKRL